jgi:hypothetical protein
LVASVSETCCRSFWISSSEKDSPLSARQKSSAAVAPSTFRKWPRGKRSSIPKTPIPEKSQNQRELLFLKALEEFGVGLDFLLEVWAGVKADSEARGDDNSFSSPNILAFSAFTVLEVEAA